MDQTLAIKQIQDKIRHACDKNDFAPDDVKPFLEEIYEDLNVFLRQGIDYKIVVDHLDDSVLVTDNEGRVLYVNPAYEKNTGILYDEVVGRTVDEIVKEGKLFSGGSTLDVLEQKKRVFRLATTYKDETPRVGYTIGVPVFDEDNNLKQVVVSSRPIYTLRKLREDYQRFLDEANTLKDARENIRMLRTADDASVSEKLIGSASTLKDVWELIRKVGPTDAGVLITGESGVGKEIVADELYRIGPRKDKPFVKVNCASIPANLLESELFGYEKGAFSGASNTGKQGLFEMANHGTLLLDEIGDMPLDLQVKLLRAIQNKEITRVGGTKPIPLDIRFIASTNSDLRQKIEAGTFRRDLYYRLSVIPIHMPPLRDRTEDLEELCNHFIDRFSEQHDRRITLAPSQIELMKLYDWPGNIRELENVIEYLTICSANTGVVDTEMLKGLLNINGNEQMPEQELSLAESMEQHEIECIENALHNSNNLREAGKMLGVNASTVSRKIKQYGIDYPGSK